MVGLMMFTGLSLARRLRHVLRPDRRSCGNRARCEQNSSGVQALPGAIPRGDIKFRQSLIGVFVFFHGIPQELSLEPVYRRLESVKKSIRERALFDIETFDTKIFAFVTDGGRRFYNWQSVPSRCRDTGWRASDSALPMAARSPNL